VTVASTKSTENVGGRDSENSPVAAPPASAPPWKRRASELFPTCSSPTIRIFHASSALRTARARWLSGKLLHGWAKMQLLLLLLLLAALGSVDCCARRRGNGHGGEQQRLPTLSPSHALSSRLRVSPCCVSQLVARARVPRARRGSRG
jgi:hypothetical protein